MEILCKIVSIRPDRTNYKMYSPDLEPENAYVLVEDSSIQGKEENGKKILTLNGFTALLDVVATAIDSAHNTYKQRVFNGQ